MARLKKALETERSLAANSAHELRTPIASAIVQLDLLRSADLSPDAICRVDTALEKLRGLQTTAVKLLQLSRAESGVAMSMQPVNLSQILELFSTELRHRTEPGYRFMLPLETVWVRGDMDAIGILMQNLLENAGKYASPDTTVEVELRETGELTVQNDCEAIPQDKLGTLLRRFVRGEQATPGSGIGLAIVSTVAAQCNIQFELKSPCFENERGFEASLVFESVSATA